MRKTVQAAKKITPPKGRLTVESCKRGGCKPKCESKPDSPPPCHHSPPPCPSPRSCPDPVTPPCPGPKDKPCPGGITFTCNFKPQHLKCLDLSANLIIRRNPPTTGAIIGVDVIRPSPLYLALGSREDILACVDTTCTEECQIGSPWSPICTIVLIDRLTINQDLYTLTRTFVVTDACGNSASVDKVVTFTATGPLPTITISDPPANSLECPADSVDETYCPDCIFIGCDPTPQQIEAALGKATTDKCAKLTVTTSTVRENGCTREQTRTWTAVDGCNNSNTECRTVRWTSGSTIPSIVQHFDDKTIACGQIPADNFDTPIFEDTCDEVLRVEFRDVRNPLVSGTLGDGTYTVTRIWTATNSCGKSISTDQKITVARCPTGPLSITCGANYTLPGVCGVIPADEDFREPIDTDLVNFPPGTTIQGLINANQLYFTGPFPKDGDGFVDYTRITVIVFNGQNITCEQTITVNDCPPDGAKGCGIGFFRSIGGRLKWDTPRDPIVKKINDANLSTILPFSQGTNFLQFFGFNSNFDVAPVDVCGISADATMIDVLQPGGANCNQLAAQGVAALLNMAAFGADYGIPTACRAIDGTPINTLQKLYNIIKDALENCECEGLADCLATANKVSDDIVCEQIDGEATIECQNGEWCKGDGRPQTSNFYRLQQKDISGFCQTLAQMEAGVNGAEVFYSPTPVYNVAGNYYSIQISITDSCGKNAGCFPQLFLVDCDPPLVPTIVCPDNIKSLPCENGTPTDAQINARIDELETSGFSGPVTFTPGEISQRPSDLGILYTVIVVAVGPGTESASCQLIFFSPNCLDEDTEAPTLTCPTGRITLPCGSSGPTDAQIQAEIAKLRIQGATNTIYLIDGPFRVADGNEYQVEVEASDSTGNLTTCSLVLFVPTCSTVVQKGCSRDFYSDQGRTLWNQQNDDLVVKINSAFLVITNGQEIPFAQDSSLLDYFGFEGTGSFCGISRTVTLLGIFTVPLDGNACIELAAQGVAALLNMAAFGSQYIVPSSCRGFDDGSVIDNLGEISRAVQNALAACPNTTPCANLASCLRAANNHAGPGGIYCNGLLPTIDCPAGRITLPCSNNPPSDAQIIAEIQKLDTRGFVADPEFTYEPPVVVESAENFTEYTVAARAIDISGNTATCTLKFLVPTCPLDDEFDLRKGIKAQPVKKIQPKPIKKVQLTKKAVVPQPKRTAKQSDYVAKKVPTKRTFIPRNV